jgi:hypothetical protein
MEEVKRKISVINNALRHVIVGVELFPKAVNIRLGYNFRRAEKLSC